MSYPEVLTLSIYLITIAGTILGGYVTYKIYSKEGFR